jgi:hypothetical protein
MATEPLAAKSDGTIEICCYKAAAHVISIIKSDGIREY